MIRFVNSPTTYVTILILFALAVGVNMFGVSFVPPSGTTNDYALGPLPCPDPWEDVPGQFALGPLPCPDPWEDVPVQLALGPLPCPDPWEDVPVQLA